MNLFEGVQNGWFDGWSEDDKKNIMSWFNDIKLLPNKEKQINYCINIKEDNLRPAQKDIFNAFKLFPMEETRILIIGQDPYPDNDKYRVNHYGCRAHGLAFSFLNGKEPADDSLLNIFKAIDKYKSPNEENDIYSWNTNLEKWAKTNKVLLLNTALTFEKFDNKNNLSIKDAKKEQEKLQTIHRNAWKPFIQQIINNLIKSKFSDSNKSLAVFLWGKPAQQLFYSCIKKTHHNEIFLKKLGSDNSNKITTKKLVKNKDGIELSENKNIKIFLTNHPSFLSENNKKYGGKFIEYSSKYHFAACDEFLFAEDKSKYIWLNFPENN